MSALAQSDSPSVGCKKLSSLRVVELKQELDKRGLEKTGVKAALIERLRKCLEEEGLDPDTFALELAVVKKSPARSRTSKEKEEGDDLEDSEIDPEETTADVEMDVPEAEVVEATEEGEEDVAVNEVTDEQLYEDVAQEDGQEEENVDDAVTVEEDVVAEDMDAAEEDEIAAITAGIVEEDMVANVDEDGDASGEAADMAQSKPADDTELMAQLDEAIGQAGEQQQQQEKPPKVKQQAMEVLDEVTDNVVQEAADDVVQAAVDVKAETPEKVTVVPDDVSPQDNAVVVPAVKTPVTKATKTPAAKMSSPAVKVSTPASKGSAVVKTTPVASKTPSAKVASPAPKVITPKPATPATKTTPAAKTTTPATKTTTTTTPVTKSTTVKAKVATPTSKSATLVTKTTSSATKTVASKTTVAKTPAKTVTKIKAPLKSSTPIAKGTKTVSSPAAAGVKATGTKTVVKPAATAAAAVVKAPVKPVTNGTDDTENTDDVLIVHADESVDVDSDIVKAEPAPDTSVELQEATAQVNDGAEQADTTGEQLNADDSNNATSAPADEKREAVKDGSKAKSTPAKDAKSVAKSASATSNQGSRNLWVSGLSSTTRATDLKTIFSKYGKVAGAKVVTNVRSPGSRCYGFVTMSTPDEASKCIQNLHRTELHGRMIGVERAKSDATGQTKAVSAKKLVQAKKVMMEASKKMSLRKEDRLRSTPSGRGRGALGHKSPGDAPKPGSQVSARDKSGSRSRSGTARSPKRSSKDDILSFEQIKAERERHRLRGLESWLRSEERRNAHTLSSARAKQRNIDKLQREENIRLMKEKEQLRIEKARLAREKAETEKERLKLEREKRDQARLNKSDDQHRSDRQKMDKLRADDSRRAAKRPFEKPASGQRDVRWVGDSAKRPTVDNSYSSSFTQSAQPARYSGYGDQRSSSSFGRHGDRYDRRDDTRPGHTVQTSAMGSRYNDRREPARHDTVRDRDDRTKYARYEERAHAGIQRDTRAHHDRSHVSPHRAANRLSPQRRSAADLRPDRGHTTTAAPSHRDRYQDAGLAKGGYSDSRQTASRDSGWHSLTLQEERNKNRYNSGQGSMSTDWGAAGLASAMASSSSARSDRWAGSMSLSQQDMRSGGLTSHGGIASGGLGSAIMSSSQQIGAPYMSSSSGVMMGGGGGGGAMGSSRQDMRYDAYKGLSGAAIRRY